MRPKQPHVAVLGAALSANKGAASMLIALIDHIDEVAPDAQVVSLSTYPGRDRAENTSDRLEIVRFEPWRMLIQLPLALLAGLARLLGGSGALFVRTRAMRTLREAVVVADLAGISFSDGRGFPTLVYNTLMTGFPLLLGVPVVKCAQAIGPLEKLDTKFGARLVLPRLRRVVARGRGTYDNLVGFGLGNVREGADLAFLMETRNEYEANASRILDPVDAPYFTVSASSVVEALCSKNGIDYVDLMATLVDRLVSETGLHAVLIAHSARPGAPEGRMNDLPVIAKVGAQVASQSVRVINESLDPRVLRSIIGKGEFLLASRFHAMISGLATSTPTVVVGWSHKYREVLAGFGLEEYSVPFSEFSVESLSKLSLQAYQDRGRVSSQITERLPELKALAAVSLEELKAAVRGI